MDFKVYQHIRNDTGEIFYVGHGKHSRPWQTARGRNKAWTAIFSQFGMTVEILARFDNKYDAAMLEQELIAKYKEQGIKLTNIKPGGFDRNVGCPKSVETREKIRVARLKNNPMRKKTKTPLGEFDSIIDAARAHGVSYDVIHYRIKKKPGYEIVGE